MTAGQYIDAATSFKKTRGIASDNHRNEYIGSFKVGKNTENNLWYLKINEDRLIGNKFPSQKETLAVLHGLFTSMDAKKEGMNAVINRMVSQGRGIIDASAALVDDAIVWAKMKEDTATDDTSGSGSAPKNQMTIEADTSTYADQVGWYRDNSSTAQSFIGGSNGDNGWVKLQDNTTQNYFEGNGDHGVKFSLATTTSDGTQIKADWLASSDADKVLILKELTGGDITEWDFSDADFSESSGSLNRVRLDLSTNGTQATAINNYLASKWTGSGSWYIQLGKNQF